MPNKIEDAARPHDNRAADGPLQEIVSRAFLLAIIGTTLLSASKLCGLILCSWWVCTTPLLVFGAGFALAAIVCGLLG